MQYLLQINSEKMVNTKLKSAAIRILKQLENTIIQIKNKDFIAPVVILNGATVGQHARHTLEFFTCLFDGYTLGIVNYDKRRHDKSIEEDKVQALMTLNSNINFIEKVQSNHQFNLEVDYAIEEAQNIIIETNLNRELAYNVEHAVHHMALIRIGLNVAADYVNIPEGFGVASSTIRYKNEQERVQ